jgi:hypothetical protein
VPNVSYVRKKVVKGIEYHYLVESRWIDGKPRQRVIAYLGAHKSVKSAHAYWMRQAKKKQNADVKHAKAMVKRLARFI